METRQPPDKTNKGKTAGEGYLWNSSSAVDQAIPPTKILFAVWTDGGDLRGEDADCAGEREPVGDAVGEDFLRAMSSSPRGTARFTSTDRPSTITCLREATSSATSA